MNHLRSAHDIYVNSKNENQNASRTNDALSSTSIFSCKFKNSRRLAEMCCIDLQPFSIVEKYGFKKYLKQIGQKSLPSRVTIATTALNDVYKHYETTVKKVLNKSPENVSIVFDMWTDKYKKISYINIKVHYCQNFNMTCVSLTTESFPKPHTSIAIAEQVKKTLKEFELHNRSITAVTDGAANIIAGLKISKITRFGCCAHSLHRFLSHDILNNQKFSHLNNIISKLKKIFRALVYSTEEIIKIQKLSEQNELFKILLESKNILDSAEADEQFITDIDKMEEDILNNLMHNSLPTLKNSVETRWNTLLIMMRSFSKNIRVINIALLNAKRDILVIDEMEREMINEFCLFLEIFENATIYLQGKNYPTVSMVIYFMENITSSLEKVEEKSCFKLFIDLCNFAKENFYKRFKILKIHVIAALLDPCQKNWTELNKYLKKIPKNISTEYDYVLVSNQTSFYTKEEILLDELRKFAQPEANQTTTVSLNAPSPKRMVCFATIK